eukprot:CAMPEP_0172461034 /NCGR_PEP_ID=MMETSP1065-20121228/39196_1 /TAXON_ID=265537 /ORGANISM="Amphiprora paludosa, Strain CCMP125" /LENGTH=70 /DNA_ID=CAMNT_0013216229 /DNA_START=314 /DNA_END=526 /DNA_ORIENTATION=-
MTMEDNLKKLPRTDRLLRKPPNTGVVGTMFGKPCYSEIFGLGSYQYSLSLVQQQRFKVETPAPLPTVANP